MSLKSNVWLCAGSHGHVWQLAFTYADEGSQHCLRRDDNNLSLAIFLPFSHVSPERDHGHILLKIEKNKINFEVAHI